MGSNTADGQPRSVGGRQPTGPRPAAFDQDDDRRLLQRHLQGEPDAFGELIGRHRGRLWAVALRTLGDPEDAADALQDAVISAYRRADSYRGDAAVTTWLHRIVVNACLDLLRRRTARPVQFLHPDSPDPGLRRDPIGESSTRLDVTAALASLPVPQRLAVILVDIEGYPVDEAARMLGVPSGTVKSRCARGRARLAEVLAQYRNQIGSGDVSPQSTHNSPIDPGGPSV